MGTRGHYSRLECKKDSFCDQRWAKVEKGKFSRQRRRVQLQVTSGSAVFTPEIILLIIFVFKLISCFTSFSLSCTQETAVPVNKLWIQNIWLRPVVAENPLNLLRETTHSVSWRQSAHARLCLATVESDLGPAGLPPVFPAHTLPGFVCRSVWRICSAVHLVAGRHPFIHLLTPCMSAVPAVTHTLWGQTSRG